MNQSIESLLGIPYRYENGPFSYESENEARQNGINCIALVHLIYDKIFNVLLPRELRAYEMYCPNSYLDSVSESSSYQIGDIIFVGRKNLTKVLENFNPDFDKNGNLITKFPLHLAVHAGERSGSKELFVHANYDDKKVSVWSEDQLLNNSRYGQIYARKRLNREILQKSA